MCIRDRQYLIALLLATRKTLVEIALAELGVHPQLLHPLHHHQTNFEHRHVDASTGRKRLPEKLDHRHATDGLGFLKSQEHPRFASDVGRPSVSYTHLTL